MIISRRDFGLTAIAALGTAAGGLAGCSRPQGQAGRTLVFAQATEPTSINMAISSAAPANFVSTKVYEGLLAYGLDGKPLAQLATEWDVSEDGLTYRFGLRPDVRWHDGQPFTSKDVAYTLQKAWREHHTRGRTVFAHVVDIDTSAPLEVVWKLSQPAPFLLLTLAASEYPVLPRHLFDGQEILTNPHNVKPVGTGPFRFATWERGNQIVLDRNADYWDQPKPALDRIVVRFLPDATATAIALETGTIDLGAVPRSEVERLKKSPNLDILTEVASFSPSFFHVEFNLDRPYLKDRRVRQAIAHAIDREFIAKDIVGNATVSTSPIPAQIEAFFEPNLPAYPFDLVRAAQLLDEAGLKPGPDGVRLKLFIDFAGSAATTRVALHMRSTLAKVGIQLQARGTDQGEYINRVFTRRDFDLSMTGGGTGRDPAIGVQRFYWSKNIKRGVAFSNGAGYRNARVDELLEAAQSELDQAKRKAYYREFQQIAMTDLPYLPIYWSNGAFLGAKKGTKGLLTTLGGVNVNFADVSVQAG